MIQVEALETIKSDGFVIHRGDRVTLSDDTAKRWCAAGWAVSVSGDIRTGPRSVAPKTIEPVNATHASKADEVTTNG